MDEQLKGREFLLENRSLFVSSTYVMFLDYLQSFLQTDGLFLRCCSTRRDSPGRRRVQRDVRIWGSKQSYSSRWWLRDRWCCGWL